jgi:hypothetical protein
MFIYQHQSIVAYIFDHELHISFTLEGIKVCHKKKGKNLTSEYVLKFFGCGLQEKRPLKMRAIAYLRPTSPAYLKKEGHEAYSADTVKPVRFLFSPRKASLLMSSVHFQACEQNNATNRHSCKLNDSIRTKRKLQLV